MLEFNDQGNKIACESLCGRYEIRLVGCDYIIFCEGKKIGSCSSSYMSAAKFQCNNHNDKVKELKNTWSIYL